jgi:hypothetical protein
MIQSTVPVPSVVPVLTDGSLFVRLAAALCLRSAVAFELSAGTVRAAGRAGTRLRLLPSGFLPNTDIGVTVWYSDVGISRY